MDNRLKAFTAARKKKRAKALLFAPLVGPVFFLFLSLAYCTVLRAEEAFALFLFIFWITLLAIPISYVGVWFFSTIFERISYPKRERRWFKALFTLLAVLTVNLTVSFLYGYFADEDAIAVFLIGPIVFVPMVIVGFVNAYAYVRITRPTYTQLMEEGALD